MDRRGSWRPTILSGRIGLLHKEVRDKLLDDCEGISKKMLRAMIRSLEGRERQDA
jgi:DNA-binding HxlR family transcriptional regulator